MNHILRKATIDYEWMEHPTETDKFLGELMQTELNVASDIYHFFYILAVCGSILTLCGIVFKIALVVHPFERIRIKDTFVNMFIGIAMVVFIIGIFGAILTYARQNPII